MFSKLVSLHSRQSGWNALVGRGHVRLISSKTVRIGCASGFWGDTSTSSEQLVEKGNIDYLVSDYLSEITMSLLTGAKRKNSEMGYAPDFVHHAIGPCLKTIKEKGVKVISNAGGTNPKACAAMLMDVAKKQGQDLKVAVVLGDDMMPKFTQKQLNSSIRELGTNQPLPKSVMSMNAYFGALPIKEALDLGADVVVTGRCVDSALVLAPLMHTFGWCHTDYDKLAAGSLAGHLLECGAQSTGGIFTDWMNVPDWENIGFPIAECKEDGDFIVTKPESTGGMVTPATVAEQLVYEIGDPAAYILPDVVCDFTNVKLTETSKDQVLVQGVRGLPPTDSFKVCATYLDGFRTTAVFSVAGKRAIAKGHRTASSIINRVRGIFSRLGMADFRQVNIQAVGDESGFGENRRAYGIDGEGPRETVVWMAVEHGDKKALEIFSREIAAAGTGMAPGLCGIVGGRPKVSPVLKLYSFLYPKAHQPAEVIFNDKSLEVDHVVPENAFNSQNQATPPNSTDTLESGNCSFVLEDLAYTRSGDKGNNANIGVVARHPIYMPYLRKHLTAANVEEYFKHLFEKNAEKPLVERFELPGINGFNFLLKNCLGGGGVASLRMDPQGKALGQMLLDFKLTNMPNILVSK
uniref:Uncharacterized protein LOC100182932 n=1 Tax=Phallusia mammillata TaxID=59560 RepID=A0A6F9DH29_9ASCI|nr:uncharacterized protein LOC100182932 [Phallusia mammillata]